MEKYKTVRLGDVISKADIMRNKSQNYPILSMTMHEGLIFQKDRFSKQIASIDRSNYLVVKRNQLVQSFPIDEGVLDINRISDFGIVSPAYKIWNIDENKIYGEYLVKALRCEKSLSFYKQKLRGTTARRRTITDADFLGMKIPLPPLAEQKHIASVLDKCTELIAKHREMLAKYDTLVKSQFVEMFGDIELSPQKKDWIELKDVTKIFTGTTPSTADEENWNGEILWITPAEMTADSFIIYDTQRKITEKGRLSKSLDIMPVGTVLLSTRAPIGKTGIVGTPMTCNQGFKNFLCDSDKLNSIYLYTLLRNNTVFLNSKGSGTTFKEVSKSVVEKIKIPVPPLELQNDFAAFVRAVDAQKAKAQQSLDKAETLYKAMMQEYFG